MRINLKDIRLSGKSEEEFSFDFSPEENLCDIPNVTLVLPIRVKGTVTLTGRTSCYVEADISYALKGECTTCLKEIEKNYNVEYAREFSMDDEDGCVVKADSIDLDKSVSDEVVLSIPISFTCEDGCELPSGINSENNDN